MKGPSERRNITNPPDWWQAFEDAAAASDQKLSEWVGEACKAALTVRARRKLSKRVGAGKPRQED